MATLSSKAALQASIIEPWRGRLLRSIFHMKRFSVICLGLGIAVLAGFAQNPRPATGHRTKARPMPSIKATGPRHALIAPDRVYGGELAPAVVRGRGFGRCQFLVSFDLRRLQSTFGGFRRLLDGIFQQAPQGLHAIFPSDLFSFFISATPVTDADLVDSQPPFSDFDRDFRLEPKAIFFDRDGLNHLPAKCLITGLHITEVDVSEAVGKQSQNPVSYRVPEVQHAMGSAAKETRPINHISFALYERGKQCGIVLRIVFEIRVLNYHEITGSFL